MGRRSLYRRVQVTGDAARVQAEVFDGFERVDKALDVDAAAVTVLIASGLIPAGAATVKYAGNTGQTLTLPPANGQGQNVGGVLRVMNTSPNTVTVVPSRGDTVNGTTSVTLATNTMRVFAADGDRAWLST